MWKENRCGLHGTNDGSVPCSWATNGWTPNPQFLGWFAPGWAFHGWCGWATFCDWNSGAPFVGEFLLEKECYTVIPKTPAHAVCFQRQALASCTYPAVPGKSPSSKQPFPEQNLLCTARHMSFVLLGNIRIWDDLIFVKSFGGCTCPASFHSTSVDTGLVSDFIGILPGRHLISKPFVFGLTAPNNIPKQVSKVSTQKRLQKHIAITSDDGAYKQYKCIQEGGCKCLINIRGTFW